MKSLLEYVLSLGIESEFDLQSPSVLSPGLAGLSLMDQRKVPNELLIRAQSAGYLSGNFASVNIFCDGIEQPMTFIFGRGLNLILIDQYIGTVLEAVSYDTNASQKDSEEFAHRLESVERGYLVVIVAKDDFYANLTDNAKRACKSFGSKHTEKFAYRDSWVLIGEKGQPSSVCESYKQAQLGPSEPIELKLSLQNRRNEHSVEKKVNIMPNRGKWLQLRKNNGALNRVPMEFYPQFWHLLSKTPEYIKIGLQKLYRDPTISVSTPEELNFGILVLTKHCRWSFYWTTLRVQLRGNSQ